MHINWFDFTFAIFGHPPHSLARLELLYVYGSIYYSTKKPFHAIFFSYPFVFFFLPYFFFFNFLVLFHRLLSGVYAGTVVNAFFFFCEHNFIANVGDKGFKLELRQGVCLNFKDFCRIFFDFIFLL